MNALGVSLFLLALDRAASGGMHSVASLFQMSGRQRRD